MKTVSTTKGRVWRQVLLKVNRLFDSLRNDGTNRAESPAPGSICLRTDPARSLTIASTTL